MSTLLWDMTSRRMRPLTTDTPVDSALAKAFAAQHVASLVGFDWEDPRDALAKVREEAEEVGSLLTNRDVVPKDAASVDAASEDAPPAGDSGGPDDRLHEELGDLLFAVVNVARLAGVDPRTALDRATAKFEVRFTEVERLARLRGLPMPGTPLPDLDRLWDEIKSGCQG